MVKNPRKMAKLKTRSKLCKNSSNGVKDLLNCRKNCNNVALIFPHFSQLSSFSTYFENFLYNDFYDIRNKI